MDCQSNVTGDDMRIYFCGGKGLGIPSPKGKTAMRYMAAKEGILLDPVYTGKAFAGLMDMNQAGAFPIAINILTVWRLVEEGFIQLCCYR